MDPGYLTKLNRFFAEHRYTIVHSHLDCMAGLPLKYAMKNGVPVRIAHAHSSNQIHDLKYPLKLFYKAQISRYANELMACSEAAGRWMFGEKPFSVLKNGIETERFAWDSVMAKRVRDKYRIPQSTFLVGHVGRFTAEKNHSFLLEVFAEIRRKRPDAMLMLVGDGALKNKTEENAAQMGLGESVLFMGVRGDVNELLQAMDLFILPSLFEGFSLTLLEAQTSGIPCLSSDRIPAEAIVTEGLVEELPLEMSAGRWAEKAVSMTGGVRTSHAAEVSAHGYDAQQNVKWLEDFYLDKARR
jgi:glycosyltransferase involved in cell wall biosynthesis